MGRASGAKKHRALPAEHLPTMALARLQDIAPYLPSGYWQGSMSWVKVIDGLHARGLRLVVSRALHLPSRCPFLLASFPDGPIAAVSPIGPASTALLFREKGNDSTGWANRQQWKVTQPASMPPEQHLKPLS